MIDTRSYLLTLVTLLLAASLVLVLSRRGEPEVLQANLGHLPLQIAGYEGQEDRFSEAVYRELNADQNVYRHYRDAGAQQIDLYVGYYGTAKGGRSTHNPYACLPGSGWAIVSRGQVRIPTSYQPDGVTLNYVVASKDGLNNVLLHWYQTDGTKVLATGLQQNVQRFVGRVLHNRNDGAYVQVSALSNDALVESTLERIKVFAGQVLELLPAHWPVEG